MSQVARGGIPEHLLFYENSSTSWSLWSLGDVIPEQIHAVSMLPGSFWSLGDVIPEQSHVTRFAAEMHITHSCHILPFQSIMWNRYCPSELVNTAKHNPKSISAGGRIWQVCYLRPWNRGRHSGRDSYLNIYIHIVYIYIYIVIWICVYIYIYI